MLEPSDFGLVAIALIVVNFFEIFRDLGIGPALIHRKENMGIAAVIPSTMMVFLTFHEAGKIIDRSFPTIVKNIVPAAFGSLVMYSLVLILQQFVAHFSPALVLVLSIGMGAVSYSGFIRFTQKEELGAIRELIGGRR